MVSKIKAEPEKSSEPPSLVLLSLPEDVIINIVARLSRWDYPTLSLVSKHFRSLVASQELYAIRSLLARTEDDLYVVLHDINSCYHWYILCRKSNGSHCLVRAPLTFPLLYYHASSVAVGSKIYVFGGIVHENKTTNAFIMDCRSHTVEPIPSIPVSLVCNFAGFIDGKIYVIGSRYGDTKHEMVVFDIKTQTWEQPEMKAAPRITNSCVVMADKIYTMNWSRSYVYEPKESKWETEDVLKHNLWMTSCVVDDVLYYHDQVVNTLRAYDPNQKTWRVVEGVEELLAETLCSKWSYTVRYGGNMALLFGRENKIWCAEISLERGQGGEIWGKVEWCDHVLTENFQVRKSLAVMV